MPRLGRGRAHAVSGWVPAVVSAAGSAAGSRQGRSGTDLRTTNTATTSTSTAAAEASGRVYVWPSNEPPVGGTIIATAADSQMANVRNPDAPMPAASGTTAHSRYQA